MIKSGSEYIWLWVAIEPESKGILGFSISKERNMLIAERFVSKLVKMYGPHSISTDGGTWYPSQACRFLKLKHHLHSFYQTANRDETIFTNAEQFDITRNPINHIGFGAGIHLCIGAPLALLKAQVVLKVLLKRLKDIELDTKKADSIVPVNSMFIHGIEHLPINFKLCYN